MENTAGVSARYVLAYFCTIFPCYLSMEIIGAKDIAMFYKKKQ